MDVRFCRVQEPSAERQTCAAAAPDPTSNALSTARTEDSCFSVDKDLHGCRSYAHDPGTDSDEEHLLFEAGNGFVIPNSFANWASSNLTGRSLGRVQFLKRCGTTA
jgi:hypothetical protein